MWYKAFDCIRDSTIQRRFLRMNYILEREVKSIMKQCTLCNEHIEDVEFQFGEAYELDDEYWHAECYAEYFGETLEIA